MSARTFRCGHPYTSENISAFSDGNRCRACRNERKRVARKVGQTVPEAIQRRTSMREACTRLHRALYRSHPYVFDAAEKAGRKVVRPNEPSLTA